MNTMIAPAFVVFMIAFALAFLLYVGVKRDNDPVLLAMVAVVALLMLWSLWRVWSAYAEFLMV